MTGPAEDLSESKAKEIAKAERPAANLVFVIDVSGSMGSQGRLSLVKSSLRLLVEQLESQMEEGARLEHDMDINLSEVRNTNAA